MFAKLTTKIALRKAGIPSSALEFPNYESKPLAKDPNAPSAFANPFTNLSVPKSWQSWATPPPPPVEVASPPVWGTRAPNSTRLRLPGPDGRPTVMVFLRHTGCPCILLLIGILGICPTNFVSVTEKTFLELRRLANKYPSVHFIAISHSSKSATDKWVSALGGAWAITVMVDAEREIYADWGLGISNTWHLLSPAVQMAARKLGNEEGNWGREVDPSGNRWQTGGSWATDKMGTVRWGGPNKSAADIPDLIEACKAVGAY